MDWLVTLNPSDPLEVRDRGLLYERLECARAALQDLQRYVELAPEAEDAGAIRAHLVELRRAAARLN
jgi:regulator of sirC expression with transglutaminase-like and TPR domain